MEQTLIFREQQLEIVRSDNRDRVDTIPLEGILSFANTMEPVRDPVKLDALLRRVAALLDKRKPVRVVLPDILFVCRVLTFDRIPFSLERRQELIHWKLAAYLPDDVSRFQLRHDIFENRVMVAALPTPVRDIICDHLEGAMSMPYRLVPESAHLLGCLRKQQPEGLLIAVRDNYITAVGIQGGMPVLVRTRPTVSALSMTDEVNVIRDLLEEQVPDFRPEPLWLGNVPEGESNQLNQGWDR